ncbi:NAD(P)-dependent dehydrogenase (short-subunit alcohol dehydrogenase family) [Spinactinospora alkalitolerans]|uniref:NAD(P)-dependent dehydrogenase (Short-subunit alcohol dehydrogenase family) n=1 Tax=Spinactinospora alkalitolerans TaxID=687207 RepID=A0A852TTH1_9ACTN|nr:SDR family oxidoreductase [Spinactinospora alkalitolerans]NYE45414.1 NAD(P)-dependent dehydrogenase (short-subunit alcohol dehydrogenase family) [Spinactinospora alkalitolerans]
MTTGLSGRNVLVSGGTRGLGRAVVALLAEVGVNIVTCARDPAGADALSAERAVAVRNGGGLTLVGADTATSEGAERVARVCADRLGGLHAVVNNVGGMWSAPFGELTHRRWQETLAADLGSAHLTTRAALPLLHDGASVVNVGSAAVLRGLPRHAHYTAAKAGLHGLTRSLARELGPRGIRVNLLLPGVMANGDAPPPPMAERLRSLTALGRLGTPEDVAGVVGFLLGDGAAYITGAEITCDGGI